MSFRALDCGCYVSTNGAAVRCAVHSLFIAIDHTLTDTLRGKIVGIDSLIRNALTVADSETALRLSGAQLLIADALAIIGEPR